LMARWKARVETLLSVIELHIRRPILFRLDSTTVSVRCERHFTECPIQSAGGAGFKTPITQSSKLTITVF